MSQSTVRPYPMIHAPTGAARRQVIDAIYAQGWRIAADTRPEVERFLTDASVAQFGSDLIIQINGSFYFDKTRDGRRTMVNSPAHLIAYCKTLGDRVPKVYPPS